MGELRQARVQTSEALRAGLVPAVTGGYLDAYTYLCRGHVFANAETGNMVLLGINLVTGQWSAAVKYIPPIFCLFFLAGAVAEWMRGRGAWPERQAALAPAGAALELAVLLAAVSLPLGGGWDMAVNGSVVCVRFAGGELPGAWPGLRHHHVHRQPCAAAPSCSTATCGKDPALLRHCLRYYAVILAFIAGAAASAALAAPLGRWSVLVACGGLVLVLAMLFWEEVETR